MNVIQRNTRSIICWIVRAALVHTDPCCVLVPADSEVHKEAHLSDALCGPRCVQFVLSYYGHDTELIDVVREVQWPEFERGTSLALLQGVLVRRGISTYAMHVSPTNTLNWDEPVIVHLTPEDESGLGHFVILLPTEEAGVVRIWNGVGGLEYMESAEFYGKSSGNVLLTSAHPIQEPTSAIHNREGPLRQAIAIGVACICALAAGAGFIRQKLQGRAKQWRLRA